eukprot:jgi/Ulvmu1/5532/UM023_0068.1
MCCFSIGWLSVVFCALDPDSRYIAMIPARTRAGRHIRQSALERAGAGTGRPDVAAFSKAPHLQTSQHGVESCGVVCWHLISLCKPSQHGAQCCCQSVHAPPHSMCRTGASEDICEP